MSGTIRKALDVLLAPTSVRRPLADARRAALKGLAFAPRLLIVGAFMFAQPVSAAPVGQAPVATQGAGSFSDFQNYLQAKGAVAQSPAATDDYTVLSSFIDGSLDSKAGAPNDAVHAKMRDVSKVAYSGDAPADAIHAGMKASAKSGSDDYSVLRDFSEAQGSQAKPMVVAAAEEPAAPAPAKHSKEKPAKSLESVKGDNSEAVYVGSQACVKCHKNQFGAFSATLHGDIFLKQPRSAKEKEGCEACHGPASRHVKSKEGDNGAVGDIVGFRKDSPRPVEERNAICLTCHERGDRTYWQGSAHEARGTACTNCHQIMEKVSVKHQLVKSTEAETCFQCHKDRRAQFARTNHMPVANGSMTCSSCHNPHGSATDKLLREASVNETCYKCHADKRGPYLWEHEPVRDSCLNCHEAHGTVNEYMLKVQRPRLCQLCHQGGLGHGTPGNPITVQSINRSCQNCHTKVHGSNAPAGQLLQR